MAEKQKQRRVQENVGKTKPIALRLLPGIRQRAESIAEQQGVSLNRHATEMYMLGISCANDFSKDSSACLDEMTRKPANNSPAFF